MIRYDLKCEQDHAFDSWFASAAAYDRLIAAGHLTCPQCGSSQISKALMAPALSRSPERPLTTPRDSREAALAALREEVESRSEYVGMAFATEARAMHEGQSPERAIHGEARWDEAKALLEDGVPVLPLPFTPGRKSN